MRDQELIGLYEAYQQVHGLNESTEELEYDTQYSYEDWVNQLVEEGYDLSNWTDEGLYEYYEQLCEESLEGGQSPTPGGITPKKKPSSTPINRTPAIPPKPPKGTPITSYGESYDIVSEAKKTTADDLAKGDLYSAMFRRNKKQRGSKPYDPKANKYRNMKNSDDRQKEYDADIGRSRVPMSSDYDNHGGGQRESYDNWVGQLISDGYDLSNWTDEGLFEYYEQLCEENGVLGNIIDAGAGAVKKPIENFANRKVGGIAGALGIPGQIAGQKVDQTAQQLKDKDFGGALKTVTGGVRSLMQSYDLYDTILEYLISEGYADTNENALVIMANMSEDWRQSIVEEDEKLLRTRKRSIRGLNSKPISQYDPEEDKDNDYVPAVKPEDREGYYQEVPTDHRARKRRASGR